MRKTNTYALRSETPYYWDDLREYMEAKNVRLIRVKDCQDGNSIFYYFRYN